MTDLEKLKRASDYLSKGGPSGPAGADLYSARTLLDEVIADMETAHISADAERTNERLYPRDWLRRSSVKDEQQHP